MSMNITKLVNLLEEVENSIVDGDTDKAKDIINYLIDDIIEFEMAHEEDFKTIHDIIKRVRGNNSEIEVARIMGGDIVGEA
jgi:poly-beta-hydroxyalkanoate depolymerase